jgi:hypothetical protein
MSREANGEEVERHSLVTIGGSVIALKAVLSGIGLSVFGTIAYVVFLIWYNLRGIPLLQSGPSVGFDITSLAHNTYLAPAYWLFVVGLFSTGCAIVFL